MEDWPLSRGGEDLAFTWSQMQTGGGLSQEVPDLTREETTEMSRRGEHGGWARALEQGEVGKIEIMEIDFRAGACGTC